MATTKENEMTNCGLCGGTHTSDVRTMPDGSSHIYVSPETQARRVAAAKTTNERLAKAWRAARS